MARNVTQKLIESHLVEGEMVPGREIGLRIDQTLTQDATGTMVMLELEAIGLDRVRTELSAQYVDHNLIQQDFKNADDHLFLLSAAKRFGVHYSRPGNGVSHPVHMKRFGRPGRTLLGSDSHTCAGGALGMLAIGAGGLEVATAMAGEPFYVKMPKVMGVKLTGELPAWVSAKDVILEMLRRHGVSGGVGKVIEYYGPGLKQLSAWDRHTIANMGAELGATTTVFPSDELTREHLAMEKRENEWLELLADEDCSYDEHDEIHLDDLVPLIAKPSSPGNVVEVREIAGDDLYQAYIGSSANPGYRDFAISALMAEGRLVPPDISLDINPSARSIQHDLIDTKLFGALLKAGARIHQPGCNGCIGMGQAPASGRNSLRTVPRNFPGRSGTKEDAVFLCSPETATASALSGEIIDPRDWAKQDGAVYPKQIPWPEELSITDDQIVFPLPLEKAREVELVKGPNIKSIPEFDRVPDELEVPVLLKVGDDISTDEIMPAGTRVLPFRSNIPAISDFVYDVIDESYPDRARDVKDQGGHAILGGSNYGQGSSREHAALAPRYLGLRLVIVRDFARIHWQNLINFGILPLTYADPADHDKLEQGDTIHLEDIHNSIQRGRELTARVNGERELKLEHAMSERQVELMLKGGLIAWLRERT